jgi:hypothetical protein
MPLGLTVHSLPSLDAQTLDAAVRTRSSRIKLLLLFLVAASPVIASYFTYYVVRPEGRRNYGDLIQPQRPMPDLQGVGLDGAPMPLDRLRHQWLLVTVADSACDARCEKNLYLSRQLRESLGKDKDRLDWVWLRTGTADVSPALKAALATAQVVKLDEAAVAQWLAPAQGQSLADHLYLVDPMGHWMMRFPADVDPAKARRDLERLMRASSSWDQPGRPS